MARPERPWIVTRRPSLSSRAALALALLSLAACGAGAGGSGTGGGFGHPQPVVLQGYAGVAMEPALSADGQVLLFNDSNAPGADTDLHWATRVDDLHFAYQGRVAGANSTALDAVPALDAGGTLYFVSLRAYSAAGRFTVHRAAFSAGQVAAPEVVAGLESQGVGWVIFDVAVSRDGQVLYFAEGDYSSGSLGVAYLGWAVREGAGFRRVDDGGALFQAVNLPGAAQYAPAMSVDGLELFFTRIASAATTASFVARRASAASPWGAPVELAALGGGLAEAVAPTPDGEGLYYHRLVAGTYRLERVARE